MDAAKSRPLRGTVLPLNPAPMMEPDSAFLELAWDGIGIAFLAIGLAILFRKGAA